ncbi:MAG: MFS transporter [Sporichthyaceae bacterium]|nr:MFS transporter [Sporichthyaceae bacterium]
MATETTPPAAKVWETFRLAPMAVKVMLLGVFINRIGGFLNIFLVLFVTSQGYSVQLAALTLGVYGAGEVAGTFIGGMLADRLGARNATVISMAGTAVFTASLLYLPNYALLLVVAAAVGLVSQIYRPASATLLSELTADDRQIMMFAMYRFGLNVGSTAAPLIGYALYHLNDERYTLLFWGEALIALAYAILALFALPAKTRHAPDPDGADAGAAVPTGSYLDVLRDRRYVLYLIAAFLGVAVYMQYLSTLPLDIQAAGVAIFWYTLAVSLNGAIVIMFELLVTKVSQTWPMRISIALAYALIAGGVAFYALPLGPAVIIIGTLIWTLGEILGGPATFAYAAMAGPPHLKGRYIGSFQVMFGVGQAVGPVVGGIMLAQLGHQVWIFIALVEVVALGFVLASVRDPRRLPAVPGSGAVPSADAAAGADAPVDAGITTER